MKRKRKEKKRGESGGGFAKEERTIQVAQRVQGRIGSGGGPRITSNQGIAQAKAEFARASVGGGGTPTRSHAPVGSPISKGSGKSGMAMLQKIADIGGGGRLNAVMAGVRSGFGAAHVTFEPTFGTDAAGQQQHHGTPVEPSHRRRAGPPDGSVGGACGP